MASLKSSCKTSSIETIALTCLVDENIAFCVGIAGDRQTDEQTNKQTDKQKDITIA